MSETLIIGALCTLAEAKAYVKRAANVAEDDRLLEFINEMTGAAEAYTARRLLTRNLTETYNGDGSSSLLLREYPVTLVATAKWIDGAGVKTSLVTTGMRIAFTRALYLPNDGFPCGTANIEINYDAGYDNTNALHKGACMALRHVARRWIQVALLDYLNGQGRAQTISVGSGAISATDLDIPQDVRRMLDPFKRIV